MEHQILKTADGRDLEVFTTSSVKCTGSCIIFCHGTPGNATTWEHWLEKLNSNGQFAIAYSRAGYGLSSRRASRSVFDNVSDTAFLLEHYKIDQFVSIGWSGGGPHCLADTTLSQCKGAISIAGVAPWGQPDLDFLAGQGQENIDEFKAATDGIEALTVWMNKNAPEFAAVTGPSLIECFGGLLSEPDKVIMTPAFAEEDAAIIRRALLVSYYGWFDDDMAFINDWGFDLSAITVPVSLWQGDLDFMVPHSHGKWLASKIPKSVLVFKEGEGHISLPENKRDDIIQEALSYMS